MEILMLIGQFISLMIYLPITFITAQGFLGWSVKSKLISLLIQIAVSAAMIIPFCLIKSLESGLIGQIGTLSAFWLAIWAVSYFERKKVVKILKGQPSSKTETSN